MASTDLAGGKRVPIGEPKRGLSTASPLNVQYRVGRIASYLSGRWLDYGCAEGGYSAALLERGASSIVGVDVEEDRIATANTRLISDATFEVFDGSTLDFDDDSFDGAFMNEVFEHVVDEQKTLQEIFRVLHSGGHLVLISPNRWFPIDGHAITIGKTSFSPTPIVPWLPERWTRTRMAARNYWPHQLVGHVRAAGFTIQEIGFIWPVLEQYRWLPTRLIQAYQHRMTTLDHVPGLRRFGLSTLVVGLKPAGASPSWSCVS
jgi:2-polyprenyl-3-methyl-5-hydroxy-6-metoxy-1,4-benzoquinol methylase